MNLIEKLQLEIIRYTLKANAHLAPRIESMSVHAQGKNLHDSQFLIEINKSLLDKSKSQLRQDLFVLSELNFKKNGFFVEFGATNGIDFSNSHLLEKEYGWRGILAEPAKLWHQDLIANRTAIIDTRCVWRETGRTLMFNETEAPELSTLNSHINSDLHAQERQKCSQYSVETVSLIDLLIQHNAPNEIDYLSIDTEGSEYEILEKFDFNRFQFNIITCEHNYSSSRDKMFRLLIQKGYQRIYQKISQFDDWYIKIK